MNLYPARARGAVVAVRYNEEEVKLGDAFESLRYTDNASDRLDEISLVIDRKRLEWTPERGKDLDVSIVLKNWYVNGEDLNYHCGNFCIDDISLSGSPAQMTVKAVSQPAESDFKGTRRTKTWKKVTLRKIAEEIMAAAGMTKLYFNAEDIGIESIEQADKTDAEFLSELCKKYGLSLKIYKVGLVIFSEAWYETGAPKMFFGEYPKSTPYNTVSGFEDWPTHEIQSDWKWNSTLQGTYTGAVLKYTDVKTGKNISATIGTTERVLYLNEKADSLADAERIAVNRVNEENKKQVTMSFSPALFHPALFASNVIEMKYLGRPDGKYFVNRVTVSLSSAGLTERVELRKCIQRLGSETRAGALREIPKKKKANKKWRTKR